MWILNSVGIVLLIMFAKSMILNPILFKKKWQAVLGYGVPGIICLLLFFGAIFLEYNAQQAYFKDQSERIATSNWQPPTVSGNVTPVKATTANSNYISIPVTNNSDLQNGLNDLQTDLNNLQKDIDSVNANPVAVSTKTTTNTSNTSGNTNTDPKQKVYVDNNGKPSIIGDTDSLIYHLPGDPYYKKEMQKLSNNVYFRTEEEAQQAGFRAIKR